MHSYNLNVEKETPRHRAQQWWGGINGGTVGSLVAALLVITACSRNPTAAVQAVVTEEEPIAQEAAMCAELQMIMPGESYNLNGGRITKLRIEREHVRNERNTHSVNVVVQ